MISRKTPLKRSPLRRTTGEARATVPAFKARKCPVKRGGCGIAFVPTRQGQLACGPECALSIGGRIRVEQARKEARAERVADRAKLAELKPLTYWKGRAQSAINAYTKARDARLPCVSCGAPPADTDQAGHYLTRGARPELALTEVNLWRQCVRCNLHLHGNQAAYRIELIKRIGLPAVESLEGPHPARKWTRPELVELAAMYRAKAKELAA